MLLFEPVGIMNLTSKKEKIANNFSKYAKSYDQFAEAQKIGSIHLTQYLSELQNDIPDGPILEIGCGTGFVSSEIVTIFEKRDIHLTDISTGMINVCRDKIKKSGHDISNVHWEVLDGESVASGGYALIVSSFSFQWFENLTKSIENFIDALLPGGKVCCSFMGDGSFAEWKTACEKLKIPYTGNPLPNPSDLKDSLLHKPVSIKLFHEDVILRYKSPVDFFRALKKIGAGTNTNETELTSSGLKRLIRGWQNENPDEIHVTYKINYMVIEKNINELKHGS